MLSSTQHRETTAQRAGLLHKAALLGAGALLIAVPYLTSMLAFGELPLGFGVFPPQQTVPAPGFNGVAFALGCAIALAMTLFLLVPRWFGFRAGRTVAPRQALAARRWPAWFWPGTAMWLLGWAAMWGQFEFLGALRHFTFVPMWWGFILFVDGLVYRRTGGASLLATRPATMLLIALSSCVGWFTFEYLDYFVYSNWYYPANTLLSTTGYVIWFGMAYTTIIPAIFEWTAFLLTFDGLRTRYASGPRIALSRNSWLLVALAGVLILALLVVWPYQTFPLLWVGPTILIGGVLMALGIWTPLTPLARGDWTLVIMVGMGTLCTYVPGEIWNYFSQPNNPNFWQYGVPFVNDVKLPLTEMPILGFFGYLPFGLLCWLWWLHNASLFGLRPELGMPLEPEAER